MAKNLLIELWKNRKQIVEGIKNTAMRDSFVEKVATERLALCNTCEHKGTECHVPGTAPCCNLCGCSLNFKLRSLSTMCPNEDDRKWGKVVSSEQEDDLYELDDL